MEWTEETIKEMIRSELGPVMAEIREEAKAKGKDVSDTDAIKDALLPAPPEFKGEKGMKLAKLIQCLHVGQNRVDKVMQEAEKRGYKDILPFIEKAMGESTISGGGALVPDEWADDFIEILHDQETVSALGARQIPVNRGNLKMSAGDSSVSAEWTGESENITPSEPTTGIVNLRADKLTIKTAISNELLMDSNQAALRFVRDEMAAVAAEARDLAFLRGIGGEHSPRGLLYLVAAANKFNATQAGATATVAEVTTDAVKMLYLVMNALKSKVMKPGFIFAPRIWFFLFSLLDGNSNPVFRDELKAGTFFGVPFKTTTQIPINLGAGTNESEVYHADFDKIMHGNAGGMEIAVSDTAAYWDGSQVQAAFSRDETVVRLIMRTGQNVRYSGNELSVLEDVKWGA